MSEHSASSRAGLRRPTTDREEATRAVGSEEASVETWFERWFGQRRVVPFALATAMFFMWAVAHNLNDLLVRQFQRALDLTRGQAGLVQFAFYLAYLLAPLPVGAFLERHGFKRTLLTGLAIYAAGAALFYPAAEIRSYDLFLFCLFSIATGLIFLELSASGYVTLVGKPDRAGLRSNFAQIFNGAGGLLTPILGGATMFAGVERSRAELATMPSAAVEAYRAGEARAVEAPYLTVTVILAVLFLLVVATRFDGEHGQGASAGRARVRDVLSHRPLLAASVAQFFYVGAQIGTWSFFIDYARTMLPALNDRTGAFLLSASLLGFFIGRIAGTALIAVLGARRVLLLFAAAAVVLSTAALTLHGAPAVACVGATSVFMSVMFPTIFAAGIGGLARGGKLGAAIITMTISGGAVFAYAMGRIADRWGVHAAYAVPTLCFLVVLAYAAKPGGWESTEMRAAT